MKKLKIAIMGIMVLCFSFGFAMADVVIIVNKNLPETSITKTDVKRIFLGRKQKWTNESPIRPVMLKGGPVHEKFLSDYIEKTLQAFSIFWKREIVSGTGLPPISFDSEAEVIHYVSTTNGAIGYISSDTPSTGVKIISTE